jgi:putative ABC transport system ATP-binding protein
VQNVAVPLIMLGYSSEEARVKAEQKLKIVGMESWANYYPTELSSGQQQKVSLARSLMNNPELLVADEPTGNLDTVSGKELMNLLSSLNKENKTIIMVTHDLEYLDYADKIFYMLDGRVEREFDKKIDQIDIEELMTHSKKNHSNGNHSVEKEQNV